MKLSFLILILAIIGVIFISGCLQSDSVTSPKIVRLSEVADSQEILIKIDDISDNVSFQLKINQVVYIKSENLKIKFLNITEDSRCPLNVICCWEGQATAVVNVTKDNQDFGNLSLTSRAGHEELSTKTFDEYSIKLLKVEPYPKHPEGIKISDYIITLAISVM